jgi:hypothetical protein
MVMRPASMASAGSVIKAMALFVLCRGPGSTWGHMVLQPFVQAFRKSRRELDRDGYWFTEKTIGYASVVGTTSCGDSR